MPHRVGIRGTILIPSGPSTDPDRKHLFVICTNPCTSGRQVLVPITKLINQLCDGTCILQPHEHAFLSVESYVLYRKTEIYDHAALCEGVKKGILIPHVPCNGQTFLRIKNGLCASPYTPRKVKKYLDCPDAADGPFH